MIHRLFHQRPPTRSSGPLDSAFRCLSHDDAQFQIISLIDRMPNTGATLGSPRRYPVDLSAVPRWEPNLSSVLEASDDLVSCTRGACCTAVTYAVSASPVLVASVLSMKFILAALALLGKG